MNTEKLQEAREELRFRHGKLGDAIDALTELIGDGATATALAKPMQEVVKQSRKYKKRVQAEKPAKGGGKIVKAENKIEQPKERQGRPSITAVIRLVLKSLAGKTFTRPQILPLVVAERADANSNNVAVSLIDMVNRGELSRKGTGAETVFSVLALKAERGRPSAKELAYQELRKDVKVPASAEEGEGPR